MLEEYKQRLDEAKTQKKAYKKASQQLRKMKDGPLDRLFHEAHDEAFCMTDCLSCANCCKTTGPLFTQKDIERIAKHLRMKPGDFIDSYLRIDEDNDYVLKEVPCAFLGADNYCSIYDVRPKACAVYPLTDLRNQKKQLNLTLKNAEICPAVAEVMKTVTS
jgi:Fe-S-cluster containining protein